MNYLRIGNQGEMDIAALTLMGATSKADDTSKIGFFGSGNKYAIATLLRNGCELHIFSGIKEYSITVKDVIFRGDSYQQICIAGEPTSLTTRLGPEWEVWMALREFYCNAIDEGMESFDIVDVLTAEIGRTLIYVSVTPEVQYFLDNISNYIAPTEHLDIVDSPMGKITILPSSDGHLYRKGICCSTEKRKSLFSYNFENILINESRLIIYDYMRSEQIATALAGTIVKNIIYQYLDNCCDHTLMEYNLHWEKSYCKLPLSPSWHDILVEDGKSMLSESLSTLIPYEDRQTCRIIPDLLVTKIHDEFPDIPIYGHFDSESMAFEPSEELKEEVLRCITKLESWGYTDITVSYRKFKSPTTMAQLKDGQIYLSIDIPLEEVLTALFEELTHRETGYGDGSRSLQTYLFKKVIQLNEALHDDVNLG